MRTLLCFAIIIGAISALSCPSNYKSLYGRCIRALYLEQQFSLAADLPRAREECAKDGGHLPIIRSYEDDENFRSIANTFPEISGHVIWLVMDLVCNGGTRRFKWVDGTDLTYTGPNNFDFDDLDCVSKDLSVIDQTNYPKKWRQVWTTDNSTKSVFCVIDDYAVVTVKPSIASPTLIPTTTAATVTTKNPSEEKCGDYTLMDNTADNFKPCFKVFTNSLHWELAQQKCAADFGSLVTINSAEENKFFWRTAVSSNILEGMHIGAHQLTEDPSKWAWIEGEVPIDDGNYANFIGSFPIPGLGNCSAMMTDSTYATWINEDCDQTALPFICRRIEYSTVPKDCPMDAPKAGEDIFPPGFPNADTPCSYLLVVGANRLVELELITLVAENNHDFLEINEGPVGTNLLANLTGSILSPTKFTTVKSNVMRVNWKTNETGDGRGFRIRYNEVNL